MQALLFGPDSEPGVESFDNRVLENMFVVQGAEGARAKYFAKCTPGFGSPVVTSTALRGRPGGLHEYRGRLFAVIADGFYEILADYTNVFLGLLVTHNGSVCIDSFQNQIMIVDGVLGYLYRDDTKAFGQITDPQFPPSPTTVTAIDSYFVCTFDGTETFAISDLNDGSSWQTSEQASAEASPDILVAARAFNKYLWLLGTETIEIRQDTGDTFPLNLVPGTSLQIGCAAKETIADSDSVVLSQPLTFGRKVSGGIFFLGTDSHGHLRVYVTKGLQPEVISDYSIEQWLSSYDLRNCFGFCYALGGTSFYCLSFPLSGISWCFDITGDTGWHRRTSFNASLNVTECWRAAAACNVFGKTIISDLQTGNLYELRKDKFTEDTTPLRRRILSPISTGGDDQIGTMSRLTLDLEGNAGLDSGQGSLPQIMLRMRMDRQWTKERWATVSVAGDYMQRARWYRLGGAREWQAEFTMTDPVDWTLIGGSVDIRSYDNNAKNH